VHHLTKDSLLFRNFF